MDIAHDSTDRFSGCTDAYATWRPGYPADVVAFLEKSLDLAASSTIVDLGAGTGIMSERLLDAGHNVIALEPNPSMLAEVQRALAGRDGFKAVLGTAESSNLAGASADAAVAAQAFHWFDPDRTRNELLRILRPPYKVGLVWNDRQLDASPFLRAYHAFLLKWGTDYATVHARQSRPDGAIKRFFGTGSFEEATFPNAQHFDRNGLEGRVLSCSYIPARGTATFEPMMEALGSLFDAHAEAGTVTMAYDTRVYAGFLKSPR